MAILTPNTTYKMNGVVINEKIIPDGTVWKDATKAQKAGFRAGEPYKKGVKLSDNTGKVQSVTIHNTNHLHNVTDDAEQYTRATYNENMGTARVHFYIDENGAWQNLKAGTGLCKNDPEGAAEVSWHAGDGSTKNGGNMTSLSLEIIMGETNTKNEKAMENGVCIAAWLLWKNDLSIDALLTHTYWVNHALGKKISDVDKQCTNQISGRKWCPAYIFASEKTDVALTNWKAFKKRVKKHLDTLLGSEETVTQTQEDEPILVNDLVSISDDATYYNGGNIPKWVKEQNWYVSSLIGNRAVIDKNEVMSHSICSPIHIKYLSLVRSPVPQIDVPFLVKLLKNNIPIHTKPGSHHPKSGTITDCGTYTITEVQSGAGASAWGKLKSGAGWIPLDNTRRL